MNKINELRDYLLENYVDEYGVLDISGLDFSEFDGGIVLNGMKVKCNLYQGWHDVKGNLYQSGHEVKGDLYQSYQEVKGDLYQSYQEVKGDYHATNIKVSGTVYQNEIKPLLKSITMEELEEMGYELRENNNE